MEYIIKLPDGSALKITVPELPTNKVKITYLPGPAEHGAPITKSVTFRKE